jgi:hypothetical protein
MKLLDIISESGTPTAVVAGPGETVYSIGRKYNVDPLILFKLNNFNKNTRLEVGQKVILQSKTPTTDKSKTKGKPVDKNPALTSTVPGKTLPPGQTLEDNPLGAYAEKVARNLGMPEAQVPYYMANVKKETAHFKSLEEWDDGHHFAKYEPGTPGGKHLGNIYPGDGKLFRGRGFIHVTGRYNYTHFGGAAGHPEIVENPDLMLKPEIASVVCYHYWKERVWPKLAASASQGIKSASDAATKAVQGGNHQSGKDERSTYVQDYLQKQYEKFKHINPFRTADAGIEEPEQVAERFCPDCGGSLEEEGRASRALCTSGRPDSALGASQLASCKSQGLRARDGEKSHLITHGARKVRVTVGGKKIKGKRYGGPLPDYGTRKNQLSEDLSVPWNKTDMANKDIEIVMHNLGYKNVDLGKGFDPETRKAFRDFQVRHGLEDKGIPDDGTITYLNNMIQKYPLIATGTSFYGKPAITKPAPAATGSGPVKKDPVSKPDVTSTTNKPTGVGSVTPVPNKNNPPRENPQSTITNNPVGPKEIEAALLKWPGMTKYHLQGIMANIGAESKYNVASFAPHDPPDDHTAGPAGGLFQWHGSRYNNFIKTVPDWRTNWPGQLAFAFSEAETAQYLGRKFANGYAASAAWTTDWERPADSLAQAIKRANYWLPRLARQLGWKD